LSLKFHIACQHLEFCNTKFDSIYPLAILIYASVKLVGSNYVAIRSFLLKVVK